MGTERGTAAEVREDEVVPQVSVIVPAYNAAATLEAQLQALSAQKTSRPFEIVVVDNGSTDESPRILEDYGSREARLRVVRASAMNTPGYSRNVGAEHARARLLAFCDADDVVGADWVETMAAALDQSPVVAGRIDYTDLNPEWLRGVRGSFGLDGLAYMDDVFPYVVSANLGVRREAFEEVAGFDPQMRVGQDGEFAWRLYQAGIGVGFDDRVVIQYRLRSSAAATFRQARNYGRARMELRRRMSGAGITGLGSVKWKNLIWLLRRFPTILRRSDRYRWLVVAGDLLGEIQGPAPLAALPSNE